MQSVSERDLDVASPPVDVPTVSELTVVVAATYTAEPIEGPLLLWLEELGFQGRVEFAPYNQIIQQLLDPTSEFGRNRGINLVLVRLEDLARFKPGGWDEATIRGGAEELGKSLRTFAERSGTPTIIVSTPASPKISEAPARAELLAELEQRLQADVLPFDSLHWLGREELTRYPVETYHDEAGDRVGHIPYTGLYNSALATAVARRIHAIKSPPYKVIALDCDNTLWKGVVGEDGPHGITLGPGMKALQEFVVAQQAAGMVVCLVSKNVEADVLEAFDLRDDFPLRRDHLVSWRISWEPKSRALAELAEELNLGLDSFIFLDDNPVECAEVRTALPQVLTIQVPPDEGIAELLRHSWAFDRLKVTEEDRKRTQMYRMNADRTRLESQAADIGAFLASLDLKIDIGAPSEDQWSRVAQLTQRTNQFNFSTRRRTETEVRQLDRSGLECRRVDVSDRFGEYGLVGVMIFGPEGDSLAVDTMLLSCRVLGRGVEHAMFAHLGELAQNRGLSFVEAPFVPSPKNEPAANFLNSLTAAIRTPTPDGQGTLYRIPASEAAVLAYRPGDDARDQLELARTGGKKKKAGGPAKGRDKSASYARIAGELSTPESVLKAVEDASMTGRMLDTPFVTPDTAMERQLVEIWCRVLHLDRVGTKDAFNDLGGTSLKAARLFVEIEGQFGIRLPMTTLLDAPTVQQLAVRIAEASRGANRQTLRVLKPGTEGGPSLFLVHDGDGEVLLYLNLARRMPAEVTVYGLEPHGTDRCPTVLTSIPEMAAYYVDRVRETCPTGPYLLGGMCAGGTIAFEMASQLRKAGQAVGLVALLDASDAQAEFKPNLLAGRRWERFMKSLRGGGAGAVQSEANGSGSETPVEPPRTGSKVARLVKKATTIASKAKNVAAYEISFRLKKRADAARIRNFQAVVGRGGELPRDFVGPSFRTVYKHAEKGHEPVGQLDAPVLLIRAGGDGLDHPGDEPLVRIFNAPLLGWETRVTGGPKAIEVVDVPGGHGGMLQEPHVAEIAGPLRAAIERVVVAEVGR